MLDQNDSHMQEKPLRARALAMDRPIPLLDPETKATRLEVILLNAPSTYHS